MVCVLSGVGVWDLATAGAFPFDTLGCDAGVILGVDVLGGGVAFTGVASNVPGNAGVSEICRDDRVFAVDSRMGVTCASSTAVKSMALWFRYCQRLVVSDQTTFLSL